MIIKKRLIVAGTLAALSVLVGEDYVGMRTHQESPAVQSTPSMAAQPNAPSYGVVFNKDDYNNKAEVIFFDTPANGMRAFVEYRGRKVELRAWHHSSDRAYFYLPEESLNEREFYLWAVDTEGNKSVPKRIHTTLDGIIEEGEFRSR